MNKNIIKRLPICLVTIIASFVFTATLATPTFASSTKTIYKKALLNGLRTCYNDEYMNPEIDSAAAINQGVYSLFTDKGSKVGSHTVRIPSQVSNTIKDGDLSCEQVFNGYDNNGQKAQGLFEIYKKSSSNKIFLETMDKGSLGYDPVKTGVTKCIYIKYGVPNEYGAADNEYHTNQVCFPVKDDGKIDREHIYYGDDAVQITPSGGEQKIAYADSPLRILLHETSDTYITSPFSRAEPLIPTYDSKTKSGRLWTEFYNEYVEQAKKIGEFVNNEMTGELGFVYRGVVETEKDFSTNYVRKSDGAEIATKFFSRHDLPWTEFSLDDIYTLYTKYINRYVTNTDEYGGISIDTADGMCSSDKNAVLAKDGVDYVVHRSRNEWCPIYGVTDEIKLNGIENDQNFGSQVKRTKMVERSFQHIVETMMDDSYASFAPEDPNIGVADTSSDEPTEEGEETTCFNSAGELGWFLCPVLEGMASVTHFVYEHAIVPMLVVKPEFLKADGNVYKIWEQFRNYGNIIFIILLILIILSQVTGFGISNYGIKKTLPRLIIMIILINISFTLMQIAVDVSNLLGYSLEHLLSDFAGDVTTVSTFAEEFSKGILPTVVEGGVVIGGIALLIGTWQSSIWLLLLFFLGAVISTLFFFIVIGIRQAGVLLLIVTAPVAIICYALPNTKKFFDKWLKLFFALLTVYPIAGLLMGGGKLTSNLLLSASGNNFLMALTAMLIQIAPFFFIPTLVRGSLSVAGNIGNAVSRMGSRVRAGSTRAISNSEGFRDLQRQAGIKIAGKRFRRLENGKGVRNRTSQALHAIGLNALGDKAEQSVNRSKRRYGEAYRRGRIEDARAEAGVREFTEDEYQRMVNSERNKQRNERADIFEGSFKDDLEFMSSLDSQGEAYDKALDALEADPYDEDNIARFRALTNILSQGGDKGMGIIQNSMNKHFYDAQEKARREGRSATVSDGMKTASRYLMQDHSGFKSEGYRGLYNLANAAAEGKNDEVFKGAYSKTTDREGHTTYNNAHFDSSGVDKFSPASIAKASEPTYQRFISSIKNGDMKKEDMDKLYRMSTKALLDDRIDKTEESVGYLNQIRKAIYDKNQEKFTENNDNYYDDQGRTFAHTTGNNYTQTDEDGNVRHFQRDATTHDFKETDAAGTVLAGGETIQANKMMTSSQKFVYDNGQYEEIIPGDSDVLRVDHSRASQQNDSGGANTSQQNNSGGNNRSRSSRRANRHRTNRDRSQNNNS